jgi:hypothetical protein
MRRVLLFAFVLSACGPAATSAPEPDAGVPDPSSADAGTIDAGDVDAGSEVDAGVDAGSEIDAGIADAGADAGVVDAGVEVDAGMLPEHWGWARYTIAQGAHSATVAMNGASRSPLAGISFATARTYDFIFDASAMYEITNPAQPGDQLDWNKLPGLSDCNQVDLAQDGFMFAWRWRLDTMPRVLELAHYANNAGTHLYPQQGIVTLDEADLLAEEPLHFELSIGGAGNSKYLFHISGTVRGRLIDVTGEHPRRCASSSPSGFKWAAGFYFGGTSTAPQQIVGYVHEPP